MSNLTAIRGRMVLIMNRHAEAERRTPDGMADLATTLMQAHGDRAELIATCNFLLDSAERAGPSPDRKAGDDQPQPSAVATSSPADAADEPGTSPLVEAVTEMRRLQRLWFGGDKSRETLGAAKRAERRVDELLRGRPPQLDLIPRSRR